MTFRLKFFSVLTAALLSPLTTLTVAQQLPRSTTPAKLDRTLEFTLFLPLQHTDELDKLLDEQQRPGSENFHRWLSPVDFRERFGSNPADMAEATKILNEAGLTVTGSISHGLRVKGTADAIQRTFRTSLAEAPTKNGGSRIVATEALKMPTGLQNMGAKIAHFSPLVEPLAQVRRWGGTIPPDNRYSFHGGYWFDDFKQAYDFPSFQSLTGAGRTIAIMAVSDYLDSDMAAYFDHESTRTAPIGPPQIVRYFPLGTGAPFDPNSGASLEAELDLQQAGGMAPGAKLLLVDLPANATVESFLDGYIAIVENNLADIVNTSFTFGPEAIYTPAYNDGQDFTSFVQTFDDVFKQGSAQGITFVESSGDSAGLPLPPVAYFYAPAKNPPVVVGKFLPGVNTFNTSWYVTSVGGTNLHTTYDPPSLESRYVDENAFPDPEVPYDPFGYGNLVAGGLWGSGGGKSILYSRPPYQDWVNTGSDMRTVPDISMQMGGCPGGIAQLPCHRGDSHALEVFDGSIVGVIGTSISAPDFAGVLALKEQYLGGQRLGNVNYEIYRLAANQPPFAHTALEFFHQGQPGGNGAFDTTRTGYNLVLGVGTPLVRNFILAPLLPPAGDPQTPSNP